MTHFMTHSLSLLQISKEDKRRRGRRKEERDLFFSLWSFALGHFSLSCLRGDLVLSCTWLVIYLEEVFFPGFSTPRGFPKVYCCCLYDCVSISDPCAYCFLGILQRYT